MTDWPQLESQLRDSARRRYGRRRFRPPARRLALVVAAMAAVALLIVQGDTHERSPIPSDERPVSTPSPPPRKAGSLESAYAVLRRPQTGRDAMPLSARTRDLVTRGCKRDRPTRICWQLETSRLVYHQGDQRYFLLRARDGKLCVVSYVGTQLGGEGCTTRAGALSVSKPMGSYGAPRGGKPGAGYTVFTDAVTRVAHTLADGTIVARPVRDNFAYIEVDAAITSLSWTVGGRRYVQQVGTPSPDPAETARGCPPLDPLPADPDAAVVAAAREAATALYDAQPAAVLSVTARAPRSGDVDDLRMLACGEAPMERSRVVELTLRGQPPAALLVGFQGGRAIVWSQLR